MIIPERGEPGGAKLDLQELKGVDRLTAFTFSGQIAFLLGVSMIAIPIPWTKGFHFEGNEWQAYLAYTGCPLVFAGLILMVNAARKLMAIELTAEAKELTGRRTSTGAGLFLLLFGLVLTMSCSGLIRHRYAFAMGESEKNWVYLPITVALSMLGAVFHCNRSIRTMVRDRPKEFSVGVFWSELFFRSGQAVLFALVLFLAIWTGDSADHLRWIVMMPLAGLLIGMFIEQGEALIEAFGNRVFGSLRTLVGVPNASDANRAPGAPPKIPDPPNA